MIILLGGRGFVGQAIFESCLRAGRDATVVSRDELDYTDGDQLRAFLLKTRPEFLINAAGFTGRPNVDACELHKSECLAGNAVLPGTIRRVCEDLDLPWGHVSSGCIYTGTRPDGSGFTESDPPNFSFRQNNCSFYSGTKALGEEVLDGVDKCFIWRLRIPFSNMDSPRNYISKLLRYDRLLQAVNSLSELNGFADACLQCWTDRVPYGIYNLTNPGSVSTRDVVQLIQKHGLSNKQFEFFDSEEQFMRDAAIAPRSNCVLDATKALAAGLRLEPVETALDRAMARWQPDR